MGPVMKKRKLESTALEEITFDLSARQDYLTGFHKRKVQRTKAAQEIAAKRAREEKIAARKKLREERREDLERHVKAVNDAIRPDIGGEEDNADESDDDDATESQEAVFEPVDHEAEYVDEDKYTSVVVEEMDVTREGLRKANEVSENGGDGGKEADNSTEDKSFSAKRKWTKDKPKDAASKAKKKRKKFRYETKAERKVTRDKQRAKNREQAKARKER